jgi:hypothetical protein
VYQLQGFTLEKTYEVPEDARKEVEKIAHGKLRKYRLSGIAGAREIFSCSQRVAEKAVNEALAASNEIILHKAELKQQAAEINRERKRELKARLKAQNEIPWSSANAKAKARELGITDAMARKVILLGGPLDKDYRVGAGEVETWFRWEWIVCGKPRGKGERWFPRYDWIDVFENLCRLSPPYYVQGDWDSRSGEKKSWLKKHRFYGTPIIQKKYALIDDESNTDRALSKKEALDFIYKVQATGELPSDAPYENVPGKNGYHNPRQEVLMWYAAREGCGSARGRKRGNPRPGSRGGGPNDRGMVAGYPGPPSEGSSWERLLIWGRTLTWNEELTNYGAYADPECGDSFNGGKRSADEIIEDQENIMICARRRGNGICGTINKFRWIKKRPTRSMPISRCPECGDSFPLREIPVVLVECPDCGHSWKEPSFSKTTGRTYIPTCPKCGC